jgi:hypothetical protein
MLQCYTVIYSDSATAESAELNTALVLMYVGRDSLLIAAVHSFSPFD